MIVDVTNMLQTNYLVINEQGKLFISGSIFTFMF